MLKLYYVTFHRIGESQDLGNRYILAYNPCHAVNLLYREFDSKNQLNLFCHDTVQEVSCLNPAIFKSK